MFKTIFQKAGEKIVYGFGFGIGMGSAFKILSVDRQTPTPKRDNKLN